jgi:lipopolysaccharide assembly outer membrane protein LptD (OstA)
MLGQYDFANGGNVGNFILDGVGGWGTDTRFRFNFGFDPGDREIDEILAEIGWSGGGPWTAHLSYRYLNQIPRFFEDFSSSSDRFDDFKDDFNHVNQIDVRLAYQFSENWSIRYQVARSFETKILLANRGSVEYLSKCKCWAAGIELRQNRQFGFEFGVTYRLVGLGNDLTGSARQGYSSFGFLDGI